MPELAYVNGRITELDDAVVSINDRGMQFGDGVYEVVRSYRGRLWAFERHMRRFENSLRALWIDNISVDEVARAVLDTFEASRIPDALVYYCVTRGVAPRDYAADPKLVPTLIVTVRHIHEHTPEFARDGIAAVTHEDIRWGRVDIKTLNLLGNLMARRYADERGVFEAILHTNGVVTECTGTSLFIASDGALVTREPGPHILPGVTRDLILECASEAQIPVDERPYSLDELFAADEALLTGTSFGCYGIVAVDGRRIGTGKPGSVWAELHRLYARRVAQEQDALNL